MKKYLCMECKQLAKPKYKKRGSAKGELYAWLTFPLGLPYTLWRIFTQIPKCRNCGSTLVIREDKPLARRHLQAMEQRVMNEISGSKRSSDFSLKEQKQSPKEIASAAAEPAPPPSKPATNKDADIW